MKRNFYSLFARCSFALAFIPMLSTNSFRALAVEKDGDVTWLPKLPETIKVLDIGRYQGVWYEIASTKPSFQKDCVCVTATYTPLGDGSVGVDNSCRIKSPTGELKIARGTAIIPDLNEPGKLKVTFSEQNAVARFFGGLFRTNYWIVDLGADYNYAVISSPFKKPIWILSRTPQLPEEEYKRILANLDSKGFAVEDIVPTLQEGCGESI
jgi:apolipoprotein D and lipocalin family protein